MITALAMEESIPEPEEEYWEIEYSRPEYKEMKWIPLNNHRFDDEFKALESLDWLRNRSQTIHYRLVHYTKRIVA